MNSSAAVTTPSVKSPDFTHGISRRSTHHDFAVAFHQLLFERSLQSVPIPIPAEVAVHPCSLSALGNEFRFKHPTLMGWALPPVAADQNRGVSGRMPKVQNNESYDSSSSVNTSISSMAVVSRSRSSRRFLPEAADRSLRLRFHLSAN